MNSSPDCIVSLAPEFKVNASRNAWSHDSIARGSGSCGPEIGWLSPIKGFTSKRILQMFCSWPCAVLPWRDPREEDISIVDLGQAWRRESPCLHGYIPWWLLGLHLAWLPMYRRLGCMWHDACLISLDNLKLFDSRALSTWFYMSSLVRVTYRVFISLSFCHFPVSFFLIFTPLSKQCLGFCGSWRRWNCNLASCRRAWSLAGVGFMLLSWHRRLVSSLCVCDHRWAGHFSASASLIKSRSSMIVVPHSPWTLESVWMTWWPRVKSSVINVTTGPVLQLNTIDVTNREHVVIILPKTEVVALTSVDVPALAPTLLQSQIRWT